MENKSNLEDLDIRSYITSVYIDFTLIFRIVAIIIQVKVFLAAIDISIYIHLNNKYRIYINSYCHVF